MLATLKSAIRAGERAGLRINLLAMLLLAAGASACAASAALQFDVFLGHDGIVQEASWFPIVCELKNDGGSFSGEIEITGNSYSQSHTRRLAVELPTGTLKRLTIPVFCSSQNFSSWNVRLRDDRGKTRAERPDLRPRRQLGCGTPLIAALPRTASGLPVLRPPLVRQEEVQPAVARWQPALFPANPLVLEGLDAIYLSSQQAAGLNTAQTHAILAYLRAGGHLIVAVEEIGEVDASGWLRSVLPCALEAIATVNLHPELQQWLRSGRGLDGEESAAVALRKAAATNAFASLPDDAVFETAALQVATGKLDDGQVVVSAEGKPLIVTAIRGRGRVTALLFSPEREPARSWRNLPTFWAKLTEIPEALYGRSDYRLRGGWSTDGLFGAMIDSRQVHKLPVPWLLLLLAVYLLIIGPLDRWWLRKLNRPMLTWITFPCYVALFSLLVYCLGYRLRAGETEWNELHVVDVLPAGDRADLRGRTFASVYSPENATYAVQARQQFAALRGEDLGGWGGGGGDNRSTVLQSGDNFSADLFVPVWTSQLYVNDWWQPAEPPLVFRIARRGEGWEATVENRLGRALTHARLVVAGRVFELGELPAGRNKRALLEVGRGADLHEFSARFGGEFQNVAQSRRRVLGSSAWIGDLANASQAVSFVAPRGLAGGTPGEFVAPPGLDLSLLVDRGQAVLLAWAADSAPVAPLIEFKPRRGQRNTLYRISATVSERN
jgi:hypothetical protein